MRWLRNEVGAAELTDGIAPRVVFACDVGEWLVVGFEFLSGRRANLRPGSRDLPSVREVVTRIAGIRAPRLKSLGERWAGTAWWHRLADEAPQLVNGWDVDGAQRLSDHVPELVDGDRLLHTDLHADQFVIGDGTIHVIDWGFPGRGAPWVDSAFLALRLFDAGHRIDEIEVPVDLRAQVAFFVYLAGFWTHMALGAPGPGPQHRAEVARRYAAHQVQRMPTMGKPAPWMDVCTPP
nr:phosphotransferase [Actinokineospora enzanensis]